MRAGLAVLVGLLLAAVVWAEPDEPAADAAEEPAAIPTDGRPFFLGIENEDLMGRTIGELHLDLPPTMDEKQIRRRIKLREGRSLTRSKCVVTVRNLFLRGDVADVIIKATPREDGTLFVKLRVEPLLSYRDLFLTGNWKFNEEEIRRILRFERGSEHHEGDEATFRERLLSAYKRVGYAAARADFRFVVDQEESKVDLFLDLDEGRPYRMRHLNLSGQLGLPTSAIAARLGWRLHGVAKAERLEAGRKRLAALYRRRGYLEAKIGEITLRYVDESRQVDLDLEIQAGKPVVIEFDPSVFSHYERTWKLPEVLELDQQRRINRWVVRDLSKRLETYLRTKGYRDVEVTADFDFNEARPEKRVRFSARRGERLEIRRVRFTGNRSIKGGELRRILNPPRFYEEGEFDTALTRVVSEYNRRGFLAAEIAGKEVLRREGERSLDVRVTVDEGPQTVVDAIVFEGNEYLQDHELAALVELKAGQPLDPFAVAEATKRILERYRQSGFVRVRVAQENRLEDEGRKGTVAFRIVEGRQYFFGDIYLKGNRLTKNHVILRELFIPEREREAQPVPFNWDAIVRSEQALMRLGFFRSVKIEPLTSTYDEPEIDLLVRVVERNSGYSNLGLGYNTVDGFETDLEIGHRNLAGHGRRVALFSQVFFANQRISEFFVPDKHLVTVSFIWPWVARIPLDGTVIIADQARREVLFDVQSLSVSPGVTTKLDTLFFRLKSTRRQEWLQRAARYVRAGLSYSFEQSFFGHVDAQAALRDDIEPGRLLIASLAPFLARDSRNDAFDPTSGSVNRVSSEWAAPLLGSQVHYIKVLGNSSWYFPADPLARTGLLRNAMRPFLGTVFAVNLASGWATPLGESDALPVNKRFFLGGPNTLRGYNPNQVGPLGGDRGGAVGGNFMFHVNTDLRLRLPRNLGLLGFFDLGNVYAEANDFTWGDIRYAAGVGFRYYFPFGPFSVDYGFALTRWPTTDFGQLYITIGNAF